MLWWVGLLSGHRLPPGSVPPAGNPMAVVVDDVTNPVTATSATAEVTSNVTVPQVAAGNANRKERSTVISTVVTADPITVAMATSNGPYWPFGKKELHPRFRKFPFPVSRHSPLMWRKELRKKEKCAPTRPPYPLPNR